MQWGGRTSRDKFAHALQDFWDNCRALWDEGTRLHHDTVYVYWEDVLDSDFNCDLDDDDNPVSVVRPCVAASLPSRIAYCMWRSLRWWFSRCVHWSARCGCRRR